LDKSIITNFGSLRAGRVGGNKIDILYTNNIFTKDSIVMSLRIVKPQEVTEDDIKKLEKKLSEQDGQFPDLDDDDESEEMKKWKEKYYRGW